MKLFRTGAEIIAAMFIATVTIFIVTFTVGYNAAVAEPILKDPTGAQLVAQVRGEQVAQVATANPPAGPTQIIKVSTAIALANAIAAITGSHDEIVGQGASAKTVQLPYELSADTRWALNDDMNALNALITNAQAIQKSLNAEAETKNGGPLKPKKDAVLDANGNVVTPAVASDAQVKLNKEIQDLLDSEKPVAKLFRIKRADLDLKDNAFPGVVLSVLTDPKDGIVDP